MKTIQNLHILWKFSRPHTIIGSLLSVSALYWLALWPLLAMANNVLWVFTVLSCLGCNLYITGLNQWADVEIDKINKPWLPIAKGELSRKTALQICLISLAISLAIALWLNPFFFWVILSIAAIGTAYSLPPLRFKRHHLGAATAISLVRGLMVNIGIYLHYTFCLYGEFRFPGYMWPLTIFITAFSLGIAWFKDIPDTAGDAKFAIKTLAVILSRRSAFIAGVVLVALAYAVVIGNGLLGWFSDLNFPSGIAHVLLLIYFLFRCFLVKLDNPDSVKAFYMQFWLLFFLEYLVYPVVIWYN